MKLRKYFILIINLLAGLVSYSQSVADVVGFADDEFAKGNFAIAAQEYNRALFFGSDRTDVLSLQIGHCYTELSNYQMAADFYDHAYKYSNDDSIKNESSLGKAFCLLLQKMNLQAIEELLYITDNANKEQKIKMHYLKGIAYFGMKEDTLACDEMKNVLELSGYSESDTVSNLLLAEFDKVYRYNKRYNPNRGYIMSAIIPGSGQMSVGAIKEGINSMLLIAGLYFFAFEIIKSYSFIDAVITLLPWLQRYYMGGMDKAKGLAISKIEVKRYESYQKILELTTPEYYR